MSRIPTGVIHADEAYSKRTVLERLGISQKVWDKLLSEGLPYTSVGHTRWVTGKDLIQHLSTHSERKVNNTISLKGD
ncbi:topoisomerase II [Planctomicrobium sp. SH527]|uniref:topoisomerase II n=1 Tax=Planctomicrobium sp. SH527 TaxID=3448123 RepID=UPI003F5B7200